MLTVIIGSFLVLILGYQGSSRDPESRWLWWLLAAVISVIVAVTYTATTAGCIPGFLVGGINVLLWGALMTLVGIGLKQTKTGQVLVKKFLQKKPPYRKE